MDEAAFNEAAGTALAALEEALARCEGLDYELKADGVIEIEFADGGKIIVNRHGAAREIWIAAKSGGHHFRLQGERWVSTRGGEELFAALARLISAHGGEEIVLTPAAPGAR